MQFYPVWSSSRGTRSELLQTEPIWRLPAGDSLSCGWEGHINPFSTAAACTARPARHLLNKSASAGRPEQTEYGRDLAQRREMREWEAKKVGDAKGAWEGINGHEGKYKSAARGERELLCNRTSKARFSRTDGADQPRRQTERAPTESQNFLKVVGKTSLHLSSWSGSELSSARVKTVSDTRVYSIIPLQIVDRNQQVYRLTRPVRLRLETWWVRLLVMKMNIWLGFDCRENWPTGDLKQKIFPYSFWWKLGSPVHIACLQISASVTVTMQTYWYLAGVTFTTFTFLRYILSFLNSCLLVLNTSNSWNWRECSQLFGHETKMRKFKYWPVDDTRWKFVTSPKSSQYIPRGT